MTPGTPRAKKKPKARKRLLPPYDPHADLVRSYHLPYAAGISVTTAWRLRKTHRFPAPIKLTDTLYAWVASEIAEWRRTRERAAVGEG